MNQQTIQSQMTIIPKVITDIMQNDPLMATIHLTAIGSRFHAEDHHIERNQPIPQHVLLYCYEGKGWYRINNKKHTLETGQSVILPANEPYSYASSKDNPWMLLWLHFEGTLAEYYAENANSNLNMNVNIFNELYDTINQSYAIDNLRYATTLLHQLFWQLCSISQQSSQQPTSMPETKTMPKPTPSSLISYLQQHIDQTVTLNELATITGYSPSYLSTLFKQTTGHAPLVYFNIMKIQRACLLLDTTDLPVNQICLKIGIDDPYYFSRLFTKVVGVSPMNYRNIVKG